MTAVCTARRYLHLRDVARFRKEPQDMCSSKLSALNCDLQKLSLIFSVKSIKQLFFFLREEQVQQSTLATLSQGIDGIFATQGNIS